VNKRVLTIDLGDRCNNRCAFCPQHYIRTGSHCGRNLSTEQALSRVGSGRSAGFTSLAFSGGEPLVRPDLPQLVAAARAAGFTEVSVTTNGRMLAASGVAAELVAAGLNRVTFSLLSAVAPVHDGMVGVPGALAQLTSGVRAFREAAAAAGVSVELHSSTLLTPSTHEHVADTVQAAAALGARIHLVQPFIVSRANLHAAHRFHLALPELAAAVARASAAALAAGTRVKPYNIPYCALADLAGIEVQEYGLSTQRRHEDAAGADRAHGQSQFFREARCASCPTPCPGFRIEHADRARMADEIVADAQEYRPRRLVLPGLDLLDAASLASVVARLAGGGREVSPMLGGATWAPPEDLVSALTGSGATRVFHLLRTAWDGGEHDDPDPGNETLLLELAARCLQHGIENRLVLAAPDLYVLPYPVSEVARLFAGATVILPAIWRGVPDTAAWFERRGAQCLSAAEMLGRSLPVTLATFDAIRVLPPGLAAWQKAFASVLPTEEWSGALVRHRYASARYNFVMWSHPFWVMNRGSGG
jgi:molybdenum cofactor biosynthesis enzyme MoaA